MIESNQIIRAAAKAKSINPKKLAHAFGVDISTVYSFARPQADPTHPDATGAINFVDRFEAFGDLLSAHPREGMPIIVLLHTYVNELFARWMQNAIASPLLDSELVARAGQACMEFGEFVASLQPGESFDADRIAREGADVIAVIHQIMVAAERRDDSPLLNGPGAQ